MSATAPEGRPRLLIVQSVFLPTPAHLPQVVQAVERIKLFAAVATVVLVGWSWTDALWTALQEQCPGPWMTWERLEDNLGLAYSWNHAVRPRADDYDYVFLAGGHCQFAHDPEQLQHAVDVLTALPGAGLVAYNCPFHLFKDTWLDTEVTVDGRTHRLMTPPGGQGVAGSITCVRMEALRQVDFVRTYGVYGPDDAFLALNMITAGYSVHVLASSGSVTFPDQAPLRTDPEFVAWKRRSLHFARRDLTQKELVELAREAYPCIARHQDDASPDGARSAT